MEVLNFIFRIGVILAVYNFLWWLIMLAVNLLRGGGQKQLFEIYFIKSIRYLFLADVIFLFAVKQSGGIIVLNDLLLSGLILLIYFTGKIQSKQKRQSFFSISSRANIPGAGDLLNRFKKPFDIRLEIGVVVLALGVFGLFYFMPSFAYNTISNWFLDSILNIEDTPVFGFVFKVVGFFFMISVLMRIANAILTLILGSNDNQNDDDFYDDSQIGGTDDDHFDDYTEVK